jgi:hypothetical protein
MCIRKLRDAALLYKAHEGHERRYLYRGRILQSYVLFWVIMFIFEILCTMTTVMEGFETGRPLYSTIDRYILICFERV